MLDRQRIDDSFYSRHHKWFILNASECPADLFSALRHQVKHIDPDSWSARLEFGGVYVNGLACKANIPLSAPCQIEYYEPLFDFYSAEEFFPAFDPEHIIYQDDDLIGVYKPPRLPCLPAREQQHFNLKSYIERYVGRSAHLPSRLDMSTQGLVIVSTSTRMHDRLQRLFQQRQIKKFYRLASATSITWETLTVEGNITRHPEHPVLRQVAPNKGKPAKTIFRRLGNFSVPELPQPLTIIEAQPVTGRTHQIRVHASHSGFPIAGDNFYAGAKLPQLHLVSYELEFVHPLKKSSINLRLPQKLLPAWL